MLKMFTFFSQALNIVLKGLKNIIYLLLIFMFFSNFIEFPTKYTLKPLNFFVLDTIV